MRCVRVSGGTPGQPRSAVHPSLHGGLCRATLLPGPHTPSWHTCGSFRCQPRRPYACRAACCLQEDFQPVAKGMEGFEYKAERPKAPTFVEQKWGYRGSGTGEPVLVEVLGWCQGRYTRLVPGPLHTAAGAAAPGAWLERWALAAPRVHHDRSSRS